MAWVTELASGLGVPIGAATLAGATFAACSAAEKAARPEALKEIGAILKDPSWSSSVRPSAIIERVFVWTFGERHLSRKCLGRSLLATLVMLLFLFTLHWTHMLGTLRPLSTSERVGLLLVPPLLSGFPSDYIALWKTRRLLSALNRSASGSVFLGISDIVLSMLISLIFALLGMTIVTGLLSALTSTDFLQLLESLIIGMLTSIVQYFSYFFSVEEASMYSLCFLSTLFTSIWAILILVSTSVLKMLAPVERFTAWFFNVEKHPVQAIGIVAGALVIDRMVGWTDVDLNLQADAMNSVGTTD